MKILEKKNERKFLIRQLIQMYSLREGQTVVSFSLNDGKRFLVGNRTFCYVQDIVKEARVLEYHHRYLRPHRK